MARLSPADVVARIVLGKLHSRASRHEEALRAALRAVELEPRDASSSTAPGRSAKTPASIRRTARSIIGLS